MKEEKRTVVWSDREIISNSSLQRVEGRDEWEIATGLEIWREGTGLDEPSLRQRPNADDSYDLGRARQLQALSCAQSHSSLSTTL